MVKKLTALLVCALFIAGAALADEATVAEKTTTMKSKTNGNGKRYSRYGRKQKESAPIVYETDTVVRSGSCSTGRCGGRRHEHMRHACADKSCGHCSREAVPAKPCCEKAVTVRAEPCLHKHVQYSWTCPATYAEAPCEVC